jgi:hypothetical protein
MTYADVINVLVEDYKHRTYLEIGVATDTLFDDIVIELKFGLDPAPGVHARFHYEADDFFIKHPGLVFDLMMVDGRRPYEDTKINLFHAVDCMKDHSVIVVKGVWPVHPECYPAYQAFSEMLSLDDYSGFSIKDDEGLGILVKKKSEGVLHPLGFGYKYLKAHPECVNLVKDFRTGWEQLRVDRHRG